MSAHWRAEGVRALIARVTRARIGLAIGADALRVVVLHRDRVVCAVEAPLAPDAPVRREEIAALLALARRQRGSAFAPTLVVAVGPTHAQTKVIRGLPAARDVATLTAVVAESPDRFFVGSASALSPSAVHRIDDGAIGAAFDRGLLDAVTRAARDSRLILSAVVPTTSVLRLAFGGEPASWRDGVYVLSTSADRPFAGVAWCATGAEPPDQADGDTGAVPALRAVGADHVRFADAFAAAQVGPTVEAVHLAAPRSSIQRAAISRLRAIAAVVACVVTLAMAVVAPLLSAIVAERSARRELASLGDEWSAASALDRELARVTEALDEVVALRLRRRSSLEFLEQLTSGLPTGSAILMLRTDSTGGTVVAVGRRAADLIAQLDSLPAIERPEIVGPVTRETLNGEAVDRLTVRFWHSDVSRPITSSRGLP